MAEEAGHAYGLAMHVYLRRHRRVTPIEPVRVPRNTHQVAGIADWWAEFGGDHPEWFALVNGKRGDVGRTGAYTNLCVSNDELRDFIVKEAWDGGDVLVLGDADGRYCECDKCMAWDGPQQNPERVPQMVRDKYTPHAMGARYARFWRDVHERAVKRNPAVKVTGYLYHNTLPAPPAGTKLNKNIIGEFVIYGGWDGWYPMSAEEDQWTRDQWLGWAGTGMSLFYRPNYLLDLYVTPNVTTWQAGELFRLAYANGMIGAYFDAYSFSWAVHGPMAYMHHRLLWDPELEVAAVRREFFSAFGPAAGHVEEYFDYWEEYARARPRVSASSSALEKLRRPRGHFLAYPPEVYRPAEAILGKALDAARRDPLPEFADRVRFLQAGLTHALLTTRVYAFLDYDGPDAEIGVAPVSDPARLRQARQAMRKVIDFRHAPGNRFVCSYIDNAMVERNFIRGLEELFKDDPRDHAVAVAQRLSLPRDGWRFNPDPLQKGRTEKWFSPTFDDSGWATIAIEEAWQKAGFDYVGEAWYRRVFPLPQKPADVTEVEIAFGAVDETACVWVNGELVGRHDIGPQGWDVPFRLDVGKAVRWGEDNQITVCVGNTKYAGGIWKPVTLLLLRDASNDAGVRAAE